MNLQAIQNAAESMDWQQVVLNGGPPCFHLCEDGRFCGRAERWVGHEDLHKFVSLASMLRQCAEQSNKTILNLEAQINRLEDALVEDSV